MLGPEIHRALAQATQQDIAGHAGRSSLRRGIAYETPAAAFTVTLALLMRRLLRAPVSP
jgi:hypothetical protein